LPTSTNSAYTYRSCLPLLRRRIYPPTSSISGSYFYQPTGASSQYNAHTFHRARSDWSEKTDGDDSTTNANGKIERQWTIFKEDGDPNVGKPPPEEDQDDPINRFVQEQLARIRSNESREFSEELAAQNDGANDDEL
jgi:hypothetical protein